MGSLICSVPGVSLLRAEKPELVWSNEVLSLQSLHMAWVSISHCQCFQPFQSGLEKKIIPSLDRALTIVPLRRDMKLLEHGGRLYLPRGLKGPAEGGSQAPMTQLSHQVQSCHQDEAERKGKPCGLSSQRMTVSPLIVDTMSGERGPRPALLPRASPDITFMDIYGDGVGVGGPHLLEVWLSTNEL